MIFRVATTNLMAPAGPFLPWKDRVEGLARALVEQAPDLLCTQEAMPEALNILGRHFHGYGVLGRGRWADGEGIQNAVLYRRDHFELQDSGYFWHSKTPDKPGSKLPLMGSARVATWAVFRSGGGPLTILNLHFSHLCRRQQARLVLARLSKLPRPWLVTGDFNSTPWPWWSAHRILGTQLHDLASEAGATWNAGIGWPIARLDCILGSSEIQTKGSRVLRTRGSDHWPVVAELEISSFSQIAGL
ncbi:MAG: endonuclease/exonuclease/phosphatase family protein [Candidatus Eremiobacteraeota bacterium]|nr:endonuclease/exonuclease/phosphatase family protein [Candidatus Eremiobacteraeota bacterium]